MLRLNREDFSVEVIEALSFDYHVLPIINEIKDEVRDTFIDPENDASVNAHKFVDHEISDEDKLDILQKIIEGYETDAYIFSIFKEDFIRDQICYWIEGRFDFSWE